MTNDSMRVKTETGNDVKIRYLITHDFSDSYRLDLEV